MATTSDANARLTLGEALRDFGWFGLLFTTVIGGTSVLALLETVFVEHKLISVFQWIVDGYGRMATVAGAVVEPLMRPFVQALNAQLHAHLQLGPHWRPLFILSMVLVVGLVRSAWRSREYGEAVFGLIFIGAGALLGALVSGLMPMSGAWWMQGLSAALPTLTLFSFFGLAGAMSGGDPGDRTPIVPAIVFVLIASALAFALGAGRSFAPGLGAGAGVVALGAIIALFGVGFLWLGLATNDRGDAALGLTTLGGFASAALVLVADVAVKALA
jgi:hypothetical protein